MVAEKDERAVGYRLRGSIEGEALQFPLVVGPNRVGSASDNEIRLPISGVSRRHAVVIAGARGLRVEDRRSKNGTLVNGERITRHQIVSGDSVSFGPATLEVEAVDARETELAVRLDLPDPPSVATMAADTPSQHRWLDGDRIGAWFGLVDAFVERLSLAPQPDVSGALRCLVAGLGVAGAGAYARTAHGRVLLLGASGALGAPPADGPMSTVTEDGAPPIAVYQCSHPPDAPPFSTVALRHGAEEIMLRVWGDFVHRPRAETLFRILIRLLARTRRSRLHRTEDSAVNVQAPDRLRLPPDYVVGGSAAVAALHEQLAALVQGDLPVVLVGETGTGKEYVARILHASTRGRSGPFAALNCAAIPADLLEAELFGIGKGVATGVSAREGRFQQARGGTLFLDEIGEMPLPFQPKLLRALQERTIQPLGGRETPIDVRILAATNVDLAARAQEGTFRADLYYRLAGAVVQLPALRQRREDIPALVEHTMRSACDGIGKPIRGISVKALDALCAYSWPGNIRELENEVRRLVYACPAGAAIESSMISPSILRGEVAPPARLEAALRVTPDLSLAEIEKMVVEEALRRTDGNQVQAGKLLGVSRTAVRRRMARYESP